MYLGRLVHSRGLLSVRPPRFFRPRENGLRLSWKSRVDIPSVIGSGSEMKEAMASPGVTRRSSESFRRMILGTLAVGLKADESDLQELGGDEGDAERRETQHQRRDSEFACLLEFFGQTIPDFEVIESVKAEALP